MAHCHAASFSCSARRVLRHRSSWPPAHPLLLISPAASSRPVNDADMTLSNFLRDPEMTWFRDNLPSARGVLIVPTFLRAGFIFGGAGGNGVLLVRDNARNWSYPAFYTVASGSVGFQAGVEVAEVILMIRSQRGANATPSNSFKLGADASVAAGPVGAGAKVRLGHLGALPLQGTLRRRQPGWFSGFDPRCLELDLLRAAGSAGGYPGQPQRLQRAGRPSAQPLEPQRPELIQGNRPCAGGRP